MTRPPVRVELVVDEVVLRGVPPEEGLAVVAALESRLAQLAAGYAGGGSGVGLTDRAEASRRLRAVDSPAGAPADLGHAVAGAVWNTVSTGGRQ